MYLDGVEGLDGAPGGPACGCRADNVALISDAIRRLGQVFDLLFPTSEHLSFLRLYYNKTHNTRRRADVRTETLNKDL